MFNKTCAMVLSCCVACTALLAGQPALAQGVGEPENIVTIDIVHTNDIHGRSAYQQDAVVGFDKLKTYIDQQAPDFVLDAGDLFHGQAFATLERGQSIAELVAAVGYDAMTPGNHDWNYGKERLKELGSLANLSILAGNVTSGGKPFFDGDGSLIKEVDGVRVGVFGVFDPQIQNDTAPGNIQDLTFLDDAAYAAQTAAALREQGCEVVIALSHQLYCDEFIAQTTGIDVLIAGHEHATVDTLYPDADGRQVTVVETGKYFENAGNLSITYDTEQNSVAAVWETLLTAGDAKALESDPAVAGLLQTIGERQSERLTQAVGPTGQDLEGRWENLRIGETNLGRVVTQAYLDETGADIAFENAGGIRLGRVLPAGSITYQDVLDIAPFGNYIVTKQITGEAVLSILEQSIEVGLQNKRSYDEWVRTGSDQVRWPDNSGSYLQFGGITAVYDPDKPQGQRVQSVQVGSEALDPDRLYTIATNNFVALGGDYSALAKTPERNQYAACDEVLTRFIQRGQQAVDSAAKKANLSEKMQVADESEENPGNQEKPNEQRKPDASAGAPGSNRKPSPQTGDPFDSASACLILLGSAVLAICCRKGSQ
ncbi:bifunctional metallophosphatase/5'-nucleotidase [Candidatus Soleaferrea massiliensis]|uniref:bifunctional metallophosphatase/5'-nucleotidase n=1 Tax=Candidatus Soleaferrea massiliensis TaxID=1470354 RepID=UPI000590A564|nr:bifunctional UDP-sugar hydrolase/5'-nucleotidase [Candidatus Soleaferrea massiliensis]